MRALNAPLLILNAAHDDTIPYDMAQQLAQDYRALGGEVEFATDTFPEMMPKTALNHAVPMFSQADEAEGDPADEGPPRWRGGGRGEVAEVTQHDEQRTDRQPPCRRVDHRERR